MVLGAEDSQRMLSNKKKEINEDIKKSLFRAGTFMQGEVKASIAGQRAEPTSVDTGRFLNSIDVQVVPEGAIIFSDVEYAKNLEYGTSRIFPRPHFRNSANRNKDQIKTIFQNEI